MNKAEQFIKDYTKQCSNMLVSLDSDIVCSYSPWLTPEQALRAVEIAIEEMIDTLEVKEVDLEKERMNECPYRKVGCTMYEGTILECNGACSWVVDYQKLKELKAQKGGKTWKE